MSWLLSWRHCWQVWRMTRELISTLLLHPDQVPLSSPWMCPNDKYWINYPMLMLRQYVWVGWCRKLEPLSNLSVRRIETRLWHSSRQLDLISNFQLSRQAIRVRNDFRDYYIPWWICGKCSIICLCQLWRTKSGVTMVVTNFQQSKYPIAKCKGRSNVDTTLLSLDSYLLVVTLELNLLSVTDLDSW